MVPQIARQVSWATAMAPATSVHGLGIVGHDSHLLDLPLHPPFASCSGSALHRHRNGLPQQLESHADAFWCQWRSTCFRTTNGSSSHCSSNGTCHYTLPNGWPHRVRSLDPRRLCAGAWSTTELWQQHGAFPYIYRATLRGALLHGRCSCLGLCTSNCRQRRQPSL